MVLRLYNSAEVQILAEPTMPGGCKIRHHIFRDWDKLVHYYYTVETAVILGFPPVCSIMKKCYL